MKKFTTLLFALLLTIPAMAWDVHNEITVYFDRPDNWDAEKGVMLMLEKNDGSQGFDMTKINNTDLYFHKKQGDWGEGQVCKWAVFNAKGWGWEGSKIADRAPWAAASTSVVTMNSSFSWPNYYLLKDGSSEQINDFSSLNHTQTVTIDGGEGTITMSSYELTAANTASATTGTTTVSAAYTANVECTATAADGYRFVGWYNDEELLAESTTYTYVAENAAKTIVAKFEELTAETPVLSNFTASATEVMVDETITFTCAVENGEVANIVYKINNEAIVGNTWTPEACGVYTATATYKGATPVELDTTITVKEEVVFNVTVPEGTPACYIAGDMNDWSFTAMTKEEETHYTWSFITTTMDFEYKYTCGTSWSYEEQIGANRTYTANDEVAAWKATELEANITSNTCYLLNIKGFDWTIDDAEFGAWFCNKNINPNKEILVRGEVLSDTIIMFYLDENHVNDFLGEAINFTHVTFLRLNSSFAFDESTDYTVFPKDYVWNSVETHCPGANKYFQLTDWNAGEWRAIPSAVNRVELAEGIGYAYGVVSAEGAIEVYNVNGAVVARGNDNVDLRGLGRGVYIIRNGNQVRKVVR